MHLLLFHTMMNMVLPKSRINHIIIGFFTIIFINYGDADIKTIYLGIIPQKINT